MKASQSSLRRLNRSSMGRLLMQQATAVETICCNKSVEVLKVESSDVCQPVVVKVWAKKRTALSAAQVAAEFAAGFALDTLRRGAHPRQSVPVATEVNPVGGCYTISVHAGQSLDLLIGPGGAMSNLSPLERLPMARRLMATLLLALQDYQQIPDNIGGARQHRDIKTSNIFWRPVGPSEEDFVFVVGDHGGFAATSLLDFFPCFDLRYLDPAMAEVDDNNDYFLLTWHGQRTATRPGLDMFQAALAVLEFLVGKLPEQLDPDQYDVHCDSGISALLHAVRTCDWSSWLKQQGLPEDAQQLLLQMLAAQPEARPTPEEAMLHPFLAEDVALVLQAEATAAKEWQAAHQQVRQLLFGEEEAEEEQSDEEEAKSDYYSGEERLGSMNDHSKSYWKIQGRLDIEERFVSARYSDGARQRSGNLLFRDKQAVTAASTGSSSGSNGGSNGTGSECPGTPVTGSCANPPAAAVQASSSSEGMEVDSSSLGSARSSSAKLDSACLTATTAADSAADAQTPNVHLMLVLIKVPVPEEGLTAETAAVVEEVYPDKAQQPATVAPEAQHKTLTDIAVEDPIKQEQEPASSSSKKPRQRGTKKQQQQRQQESPSPRTSPHFGLGSLLQHFTHGNANSSAVVPAGGSRLVRGMHRVMGCGGVDAL